MKVICKYNDPSNLPSGIPDNFDYGLELSKEYLVMGVLTFKQSNNLYFLIDENSRPSWFPYQIFETVTNELPANWFVKINIGDDYVDYQNLIGFDELCNKEDFFNQLLERDEEAMRTYFRRKIELEKELAE
ncbi:hypothetical protein DC498_25465 [Terrimonas sp.]|uniref:hypothetical protein n=1 Tax=Terrimonas sp. TaxID=1914338 RepID=UPI000D51C5EF|nr:hypothetical protein [Terrimonas sp.]PVD49350.1 hypothetical protein DC498_25465 [Terrimonas sp.]